MELTARTSHRYLGAAGGSGGETLDFNRLDDRFELDESEVWAYNGAVLPERCEKVVYNHHQRRPVRKALPKDDEPIGQKSLPLNIPDWPKILGGECRPRSAEVEYEEEEEGGGNDRIPPHEYLARNRVASPSVHEGAGRTLKGRDLSRVRNAIWKKTGYED